MWCTYVDYNCTYYNHIFNVVHIRRLQLFLHTFSPSFEILNFTIFCVPYIWLRSIFFNLSRQTKSGFLVICTNAYPLLYKHHHIGNDKHVWNVIFFAMSTRKEQTIFNTNIIARDTSVNFHISRFIILLHYTVWWFSQRRY